MGLALCWARREYSPTGTGAGRDRLVCNVLHRITLRWLLLMGDRWEGLELHYNTEFIYQSLVSVLQQLTCPIKSKSFKSVLENAFIQWWHLPAIFFVFLLELILIVAYVPCGVNIVCYVICPVVSAPAQFTCTPSWFICFCPGVCQWGGQCPKCQHTHQWPTRWPDPSQGQHLQLRL